MKSLDWSGSGITGDIGLLSENINLNSLVIFKCPNIKGDITGLSEMTDLEDLSLCECNISGDICGLTGLNNLEDLNINSCELICGELNMLDVMLSLKDVDIL